MKKRLFKRSSLVTVLVLLMVLVFSAGALALEDLNDFPAAVDPTSWEVPENMTWADWQDNPCIDWANATLPDATHQKGLLILVDYADLPFVMSYPEGTKDPLGNPQIHVPENELAQWWEDFLNVPSELNNWTSIDSFWKENSFGNWDVEIDAYGPYHLEGMEWEYGVDSKQGARTSPRNITLESMRLFLTENPGFDLSQYNFAFILHAGYDESGAWQEAGEMMFNSKEEVSEEFGPTKEELESIKAWGEKGNDISWAAGLFDGPDYAIAEGDAAGTLGNNYAGTRYVEWAPWLVAKSVWSHTTYVYKGGCLGLNDGLPEGQNFNISVQGESDGMATFAHEFGHIRDIGDNYNNPYGIPDGRTYTGGWETMSRGSFAGPGGTHTRWEIPSRNGSSAPAPHTTRLKLKQDFYTLDQYNQIDEMADLIAKGPVFETIVAREIPTAVTDAVKTATGYPGVGYGVNSLIIEMDADNTPVVTKNDPEYNWQTSTWGSYNASNPYYDKGYYQFYSMEVVQRVGYDSFSYDEGVMIIMNRATANLGDKKGGPDYPENERAPYMWVIDAHPDDINLVDFVRPDGTEAMVSKGDARQLADALFHAGTGEGVVSEYYDEYNKLHFYVLEKNIDDNGVMSYRVAVRSEEQNNATSYNDRMSVTLGECSPAELGKVAVQEISITNNGNKTGLYRLTSTNEAKWETALLHEVIEVEPNETVTVSLYLDVASAEANNFSFTVTSEVSGRSQTVNGTITNDPYELVIEDGKTQAFVDPNGLIHEEVWIETTTDTDGDGKRDLIYAKITRPGETEYGLKSPTIVDPTPYDSTTSSYSTAFSADPFYEELGYANDWDWFNGYIMNDPDHDYLGADNPDTTSNTYADDIAYTVPHTYAEIAAWNFNPPWLPAQREAESVGEANRIGSWLTATNWKHYFISRGYAVLRVNTMGDFNSEGLITVGDYNEALAMASVVDWLNGRVKAFTSPEGKVEVKADWANGKAAFNGTSYPGQLSLMAAMTGVDGLETIIPEAAPINWYDYYRANGSVWAPTAYQGEDLAAHMVYCQTRQQDKYYRGQVSVVAMTKPDAATHNFIREYIEDMKLNQYRNHGDYTKYWDARNKAIFADDIECSILITHGLNDWNVKFKHAALLVELCKKYDIEWKAIFHSGAHTSALSFDGIDVYNQLHGWLDHYLVGLDNGMPDDMANVSIVNSDTMEWETYDTWPIENNEYSTLYLNDLDGNARVGTLSYGQNAEEEVSFKDTYIPSVAEADRDAMFGTPNNDRGDGFTEWQALVIGGDMDIANMDLTKDIPDRLLYLSEPLSESVRLSGTSKITLEVKADKNVGSISVMIVDYGENYNATRNRTSTVDLGNGRTASLYTPVRGSASPYKMVTVGAVDVQNPNPTGQIWLEAADTNFVPAYWYQTKAITPGEYNTYTFELTATDHVFAEGHQIGVIIYGSDPRYTTRPYNATEFTVDLSKSKLELPLIGEVDCPLASDFVIEDNATQPFVNWDKVIYEEIWVETALDTDNDGERDLIYARIARPGETEYGLKSPSIIQVTPYTTTNGAEADLWLVSPDKNYDHPNNPDTTDYTYNDVEFTGHTYAEILEANFNPDWLPAQRIAASEGVAGRINAWSPGSVRNYFISRGYAAINVSSIGDINSEGLVTVGDYNEALAAAAIVDWLNGRVKAFTTATEPASGWVEVKANWSNGKAAMNGTSYNGALPLAAAMTGVEGLETIIPEAPPFNWYDYYRTNGMVWAPGAYQGEDCGELQVFCQTRHRGSSLTAPTPTETTYIQDYLEKMVEDQDRTTGDYNEFWDARNMAKYAEDVTASILITHGFSDWNVKFKHSALVVEMCKDYDITWKAIFHPGGHSSALGYDGMDVYDKLQGWMDYHLLGLENGIMEDMANVTLFNMTTAEWEEHDTWPLEDNEYTRFYLNGEEGEIGYLSPLQKTDTEVSFVDEYIPHIAPEDRTEAFGYMSSERGYATTEWENLIVGGDTDIANMDLTKDITDRVLFLSEPLEDDMRISGTTRVSLTAKPDKKVGAISVMIVDYGDVYGITNKRNNSTVDLGNGGATGLSLPVHAATPSSFKVVTRGSVDVQNPNPDGDIWLDAVETNYVPAYWYQTTAITPGEYYDYVFDLMPTDYVIEAGHRLGVIVYGSDARYTTRPFDPTSFTVDLSAGAAIDLPLVDYQQADIYTIDATASEGGAIDPEGEQQLEAGESITFTIEADDEYQISDVLVDGASVGIVTEYTFEDVRADHTIHAEFSPIEPDVYTVTARAGVGGTIDPEGQQRLEAGESITFTIAANELYEISDVLVDGESIGVVTEYTFDGVDDNHTIYAEFRRIDIPEETTTYTITARAGVGGTIDPSGQHTVPVGESRTYTIKSDRNYEITDVLVDGESIGIVTSYTFEDVRADHTIYAEFTRLEDVDDKDDDDDDDEDDVETYTIKASAGTGGSISPSGSVKVERGDDEKFTITANENYVIKDVLVDGESVGAVSSYTFKNVKKNHSIDAEFEQVAPTAPVVVNPFIDVNTSHWFYNDVMDAYQLGLINGRTANTYAPDGNVTIAEAIKLAATMHQLYTTGSVTLTNGSPDWFSTYVDYAVANNIIKAGEYPDMNAVATRAQFASIFAAALPDTALAQINNIADNKLPDVKITDSYGPAVYKLYRAGILNGNDTLGTFGANTNIKRSEVAAIVNRMMNPEKRITLNL